MVDEHGFGSLRPPALPELHAALLCVFGLENEVLRRGEELVIIERAAPVPS